MPANLRFRYSVCDCKAIVRGEQASRHGKMNPSHKVVKTITCCVPCIAVADSEAIASGAFYKQHEGCPVTAANAMKTRVFIQMVFQQEGIKFSFEGGPEKRGPEKTIEPPAQRGRTLSSSSSSSSESDFEQPPPATTTISTAQAELEKAIIAINPAAIPTVEDGQSNKDTDTDKTLVSTQPSKEPQAKQKPGIATQARKWDKHAHTAAVSQSIQITKLLGKIKSQEAIIKTLNESLESAQRKLIENKIGSKELTQWKAKFYSKEKELQQQRQHFETTISTQRDDGHQLNTKIIELKEKLRQMAMVEEEERCRRKELEKRLASLADTHTQHRSSIIHVPHYQNTILSDEVTVSDGIFNIECVADNEINCIHLHAQHEGKLLNVQHIRPPTPRELSDKTKDLINSLKSRQAF